MAQKRYHDYFAEATTQDLNEHFDQVQRKCKIQGMEVAASGTWQVSIGPGTWLCDGVVIEESSTAATLDINPASDSDRWDIVYGQYTYQPNTPPPEATYGVKQGVPAPNPELPSLEANQVALAYIFIPASAASLADCTIYQAYGLKEQMEMLLRRKLEGSFWVRPSDPKEDGEWVKDGDVWIDTDTDTIYIWDEPTQTWVPPTIPPHAITHSAQGSDPIDIANLADSLGFLRRGDYAHYATKEAHEALHISHKSLSEVGPDDHHPRDHADTHLASGQDPLPWGHGGGLDADMVDGHHAAEFAPVNHTHEGYAPIPHGNEAHMPAFAEVGHQHPLSDITGTIATGWIGPVDPPDEPAPTGGIVHEERIGKIYIAGTKVVVTGLQIHFHTAPSSNVTYTFKVNGTAIGQVTVPGGQTDNSINLSPPVELSDNDLLQIEGPADAGGAAGLDAKFLIARVQA